MTTNNGMRLFWRSISTCARRSGAMLPLCVALIAFATPAALAQTNSRVSAVLALFDIDGDGRADESSDTDGDGLPDSWEVGGVDLQLTDVPFPAPQAIVPGTPPSSIFARRPVRTSATIRDTDGDGLSDFIEVFGLKFIDDNANGILDADEWTDLNVDGMPSIGEWPLPNRLAGLPAGDPTFDFDGFVFTDPTNPDSDGDGISDGADNDPLVNPRSFGIDSDFFPSGTGDLATDVDLDNDGLGNGMDLGNDTTQLLDNPSDLRRVLEIFRRDLLQRSGSAVRVPEGLIEDLLGADWNGDGLFRLTDIQQPHFGLVTTPSLSASGVDLFRISLDQSVTAQLIGHAVTPFPTNFSRTSYFVAASRGTSGVNAPLPYQELLRPAGRNDNVFLPDPRIWTVLYAWRMPGFDVDGNGFIGYDSASVSALIDLNGQSIFVDPENTSPAVPTTEVRIPGSTSTGDNNLDGVIEVPSLCPTAALLAVSLALVGMVRTWPRARRA